MIIRIGIVLLALIAGGTLFALDYLIKQDQKESAEQMHQVMQQTRAAAQTRAEAKARFESQLLASLSDCQANALKTHYDYVGLIQKAVNRKRAKSAIPEDILDEAAELQSSARAECKNYYDKRLIEGP
jgi:hypothetical protein